MTARGLFIGRFQPFHKDHLEAIKYGLARKEEMIVGVADGEKNFEWRNPFTVGERIEMIWRSFEPPLRQRCLVLSIPDQPNNRLWADYVMQYLPSFETVYTRNPLTAILMENAGFPVENEPKNLTIRATRIRELILKADPSWQDLVPAPVVDFLRSLKAEERLQALAKEE